MKKPLTIQKFKAAAFGIAGGAAAGLLAKTTKGIVSIVQNLLPSRTQKEGVCPVPNRWHRHDLRTALRRPLVRAVAAASRSANVVHKSSCRSGYTSNPPSRWLGGCVYSLGLPTAPPTASRVPPPRSKMAPSPSGCGLYCRYSEEQDFESLGENGCLELLQPRQAILAEELFGTPQQKHGRSRRAPPAKEKSERWVIFGCPKSTARTFTGTAKAGVGLSRPYGDTIQTAFPSIILTSIVQTR